MTRMEQPDRLATLAAIEKFMSSMSATLAALVDVGLHMQDMGDATIQLMRALDVTNEGTPEELNHDATAFREWEEQVDKWYRDYEDEQATHAH